MVQMTKDETAPVESMALKGLIEILHNAYSGEMAAAYAYRGHWHSVRDAITRTKIQTIEQEEWHHRNLVGHILKELGDQPQKHKEIRANIIGRVLGSMCHLTGWLLPMYGAGRLESRNIKEYEIAARYAFQCGQAKYVDCLLTMAEVEWEHEHYFRGCVKSHWLNRFIPLWKEPPLKEEIRLSFAKEFQSLNRYEKSLGLFAYQPTDP